MVHGRDYLDASYFLYGEPLRSSPAARRPSFAAPISGVSNARSPARRRWAHKNAPGP